MSDNEKSLGLGSDDLSSTEATQNFKLQLGPERSQEPIPPIPSYSHWYDAFRPSSFKRPTEAELGFDTTGMSSIEITQHQMSRAAPSLSRRHLIVVTCSAGVGTGLFIGTGNTLPEGGPAALIIGFGLMSIALVCVMLSTAELNLRYPTINPMSQLAERFIDSSWGFAIGWIYMFGYMVSAPLEIIAGAELTQFWHDDNNSAAKVNPVAWVSLIYVLDVCIHFFGGSRGYGELEFVVGSIKFCAIIGWIIFAIIYVNGGVIGRPEYIGGKYFHDPGAFAGGFKGVIQVIVSASFAYGGTEVTGLAAAETSNPIRSIPSSTRQTFWRTLVLFMTPVILVGFCVPYDDPQIGSSNTGSGSPFVRALQLSGIHALPSIFNVVIICSVIGVSNSSTYAANRSLVGLAMSGMAPKWLAYVDRRGRPVMATVCLLTFALLCFVCASDKYNDVFNWLYAFAQLAFLYVWSSVCLAHIKLRLMMRKQGRSLDELVYKSPLGIPGAIVGAGILIFVYCLQFWPAATPANEPDVASYFFQQDLSVPCALALFLGHKIYVRKTTGNWGFKVFDLDQDLDSGVRLLDMDEVNRANEEYRQKAKSNFFRRIAYYIC